MQLLPPASSKAYNIPVFFESIFDIPDMFEEQSGWCVWQGRAVCGDRLGPGEEWSALHIRCDNQWQDTHHAGHQEGEIMTRLVWWLLLVSNTYSCRTIDLIFNSVSDKKVPAQARHYARLWRSFGEATGVGQQHQDSEQEEGRGIVGNTSGEVDFSNRVLDT